MSSISLIQQSSPLTPSRRPQAPPLNAPLDQLSLGAAPESHPSRLLPGLLALGSLACALAPAAASAQQIEQTQASHTVERHQSPLSADQAAHLQDLAQERKADQPSAAQVRSDYRNLVRRVTQEADLFVNQSRLLEQEGQRLDQEAQGLGSGQFPIEGGTLTVERAPESLTVTEQVSGHTTSLRHQGEVLSVEQSGERGRLQLEDGPGYRTVRDGLQVRTLYLEDAMLYHAGEFELQNTTRSYKDDVTVEGSHITRRLEPMMSFPGRTRSVENQSFEEREGGGLLFKDSTKNLNSGDPASTREIEIRPDGTTRSGSPTFQLVPRAF